MPHTEAGQLGKFKRLRSKRRKRMTKTEGMTPRKIQKATRRFDRCAGQHAVGYALIPGMCVEVGADLEGVLPT